MEEARERRGGDRDRETGGKPSSPSASKELNQERRTAGRERERRERERGYASRTETTDQLFKDGWTSFLLSFLPCRQISSPRKLAAATLPLLLSHFLDIVSRRAEKVRSSFSSCFSFPFFLHCSSTCIFLPSLNGAVGGVGSESSLLFPLLEGLDGSSSLPPPFSLQCRGRDGWGPPFPVPSSEYSPSGCAKQGVPPTPTRENEGRTEAKGGRRGLRWIDEQGRLRRRGKLPPTSPGMEHKNLGPVLVSSYRLLFRWKKVWGRNFHFLKLADKSPLLPPLPPPTADDPVWNEQAAGGWQAWRKGREADLCRQF